MAGVNWYWAEGFETGMPLTGTPTQTMASAVGTVTIDTTTVRTGTRSLKIVASASVQNSCVLSGMSTNLFDLNVLRYYVRFTTFPASTRGILCQSGAEFMKLNASGLIEYYDLGTGIIAATGTVALTDTSKWYRIEIWTAVFGTNETRVYVDGVLDVSLTSGSVSVYSPFFGCLASGTGAYTMFVDDIVQGVRVGSVPGFVADDLPGPGGVICLRPTADAQRGSWTGGAGGTTNLWDAVNNLPPTGVASASQTNTTNIESADSSGDNATDEYRATFPSYSSVGITGIILQVQPFAWHAEDVATGTKTISLSCTNPTIAAASYTVGRDAGAAGAFPTNWQRNDGNSCSGTYNPSVVLGTAPQLQLRKTDTGTRTVLVCGLGITVAYQDAVYSPPTMKIPRLVPLHRAAVR